MQSLIRRRVLCPSPGFTDNLLYTTLWRHDDKNNADVNNRYLDFVQTGDLISFVNENHVDNILDESLVYVYFGSIYHLTDCAGV